MSESQYTPWDQVFGPQPPENLVPPAPIPAPVVVVPTPAPVPVPTVPVNPPPATPSNPQSTVTTIIATLIVAVGVGAAGYFLVNKKDNNPQPVTPSGPVLPVVDSTLSKMLPDDAARGTVASFFRDVSDFVSTTKVLTTTGEVRQAVQAAVKDLKAAIGEPNWNSVNAPISSRISTALGGTPTEIPDIPLDVKMENGKTPREILVKEYAQIAVDCRGG